MEAQHLQCREMGKAWSCCGADAETVWLRGSQIQESQVLEPLQSCKLLALRAGMQHQVQMLQQCQAADVLDAAEHGICVRYNATQLQQL